MRKNRHLGADGHCKSLLKLAGAKLGQRKESIRSKVYKLVPKHCDIYLEPFGGSFCVLIGKNPVAFEAINDASPWPVNFFRCLRKDPIRLYKLIQRLLKGFDKAKFNRLRKYLTPDHDFVSYAEGFPAAATFYCITKMSMNGVVRYDKFGRNNSTYCGTTRGRGLVDLKWLKIVYRRMRNVKINQEGYQKFLVRFDHKDAERTFIYLDPPYDTDFSHYVDGPWTAVDHQILARFMKSQQGLWAMSYNDSAFIRELYDEFYVYDIATFWSVSSTPAGRGPKTELLITNFELSAKQQKALLQ